MVETTPSCPVIPSALTDPTPLPGQLPATYGELADYTLALQEALAQCNTDKRFVRSILEDNNE